MAKGNALRNKVLELTGNFLEAATDLLLWNVYFALESAGGSHSTRGVYRAAVQADKLIEQINYQSFCRAFYQIKRRGLINLIKESGYLKLHLSDKGQERIESLIPVYDNQRHWDKRFYLITYDIPENKRDSRARLRQFLQKLRAGKLQASVYLSPYNPRKKLKEYVERNRVPGSIIVSDTGIKGSIGTDDFRILVNKVYSLEDLNRRYQEFVKRYSGQERKTYSRSQVALDFNLILKDDPQLPFELLPSNWEGAKAYQLYQNLLTPPTTFRHIGIPAGVLGCQMLG